MSPKLKKITLATTLFFCLLVFSPLTVFASSPKAVAEELAHDITFQRHQIEGWISIHPDLSNMSSWDFGNRIRIKILMNEGERKLYSQTYQLAVELYDLSRESLDTAENSFQRGDYPDAKKYLVLSINRLLYASIMYDAAHQVWNDEITTAQQTLYSICKTSGEVAGLSFGGALGNPVISVAMKLEIAAVCNDAFGKGAKQTFWDIAWTTVRELIGIVSKPVAVTIGIIKELPLVEKAFAPVSPPSQPADVIYDFLRREELLRNLPSGSGEPAIALPRDTASFEGNTTPPQPSSETSAKATQPEKPPQQPTSSVQSSTKGKIIALVMSPNGEPVNQAKFWLVDSQGRNPDPEGYEYRLTNKTGQLETLPVPNGRYTLNITCELHCMFGENFATSIANDTYARWSKKIEVGINHQEVNLDKVALKKWTKVTFAVLSSDGQASPFFNIKIKDDMGRDAGNSTMLQFSGGYSVSLPDGTYTLIVDARPENKLIEKTFSTSGGTLGLGTMKLEKQ